MSESTQANPPVNPRKKTARIVQRQYFKATRRKCKRRATLRSRQRKRYPPLGPHFLRLEDPQVERIRSIDLRPFRGSPRPSTTCNLRYNPTRSALRGVAVVTPRPHDDNKLGRDQTAANTSAGRKKAYPPCSPRRSVPTATAGSTTGSSSRVLRPFTETSGIPPTPLSGSC